MRGQMDVRTEDEQQLAKYKAMLRAEFAFKQRLERLDWEVETLQPLVSNYVKELTAGRAARVELEAGQ